MSCHGDCIHLFDTACDLVRAREIVILRTITDPENVRSFGGEDWNNSSQRSLWSSPEPPRSSQRNWSLPRSESRTERETDFVVKDWSSSLNIVSINMVHRKIIHECSSLSHVTITVLLGQPAFFLLPSPFGWFYAALLNPNINTSHPLTHSHQWEFVDLSVS